MSDVMSELHFEAPGAGSWSLDAVHFPRPVTRYWTEIHPAAGGRGFDEFTAHYGLLVGMQQAYVNGFMYASMKPAAPEEVPARFARAEKVWERKLWREQLREWDETFKPASIRTHRELQSVDPAALSDESLAAHLYRCREHHREMIYQHMRFTGAATIALGDLLAHVGDWTGLAPAALLSMMRGSAPVSAGASGELAAMIAAFADDPDARALLFSNQAPEDILSQLQALDSDAGGAVSAYLELTGYRLLDGFDIAGRYALEMPDVLLRAIRAAVQSDEAESAEFDVDARIAEIRAMVPAEHAEEFDELLGEARLMYRIRDERGVFSDIWASGIMRRAVIGAGQRLADRGQIDEAEHLIDAGFDEMTALLSGTGGPSAEELAQRHRWRTTHTAKDAPQFLGEPPQPPPDLSGLPPAVARVMRVSGITSASMFIPSMQAHEGRTLRGLAASGGVYEGPARRVAGPSEFNRIVRGDVLVTECTSEAFNILLPLLGALVTDSGGVLSHPAIVAREYGIPGVVGTRNATDQIADGARVRVDGDAGSVTVLD